MMTMMKKNIIFFLRAFTILYMFGITRNGTAVKLYETLFQKFSTVKRSVSIFFSLQTLVAECFEMLTGMNMFDAPSFCSVLFARFVINFNGNMGIVSQSKSRRGGKWAKEQTK